MRRLSFFFAIVSLAVVPVRGSTILFSENFDELTPTFTATSVGGFSATGGTNVDILGAPSFDYLCVSPASGTCIDMDGTNGDSSQGILQTNATITLQPGTSYFLSFDLIGSQRDVTASTTVSFGPYLQTFSLASGDTTTGHVVNALITVSSPTTVPLIFTSNTPGNTGNILDNVLITADIPDTSPTPEPSSLILLGSGFIGTALLALRRKARN